MLPGITYKIRSEIAFCLFVLLPLFGSAQINTGLVAKYSFNNSETKDEVGNNNPKLYNVSPIEDRFGNEKSAYFLHGNKNSYINLGVSNSLKPTVGSISIWIKIEHIMESGKGIESNPILITRAHAEERHCEAYYIGYDYKTKNINVNTTYSKLDQISVYSEQVSLRRWHHIVMTYNDDFLSFYLDGVLETKMPKNFKSRFLEGDSIIVGNLNRYENVRFYNGCIDDIQIFNRVLTGDEVSKLFNAPNPQTSKTILYWALTIITLLGVVIFATILIIKRSYRRKLDKEKAVNAINSRLIELETKAIRTQMNPHFIFNSLNTLQRFILEEDISNARLYLSKFSKLLRKMLESSIAETISLSEEISIINNYIEVEKLRFANSFEYEIRNEISNPENIKIPFMLIQPLVENAIWHGLLPKAGLKKLGITFSDLDSKRILCVVDDNGVGRDHKDNRDTPLEKRSLAIDFIKQRLDLLQKTTGSICSLEFIDKKDDKLNSLGTKVQIIIPKLD